MLAADSTPLPVSALRRRLLNWYEQNRRDLPWRRHPSPYHTVVSEFMLQQTQVATVLPYFEKWVQSFPDFPTLGAAPEETVLKHWEGLGYYSRARNLHQLAREVAAMDALPQTAEDWIRLPGVGPYTAAAIASIAFGQPAAVADGNVVRVLARLRGDTVEYPDAASALKSCRPHARKLLYTRRPGDFNQAVMELGALICRPRQPACLLCPWREHCRAHGAGIAADLPRIRRQKTVSRAISRCFARRQRGDRTEILLERISGSAARLAGQYQLPAFPAGVGPAGPPLLVRSRGIGNERIRESIFAPPPGWPPNPLPTALHWVPGEELDRITIPGPHRRWITQLLHH